MTRFARNLMRTLLAGFLLLALVAGSALLLVATTSGSRWVLARAQPTLDAAVGGELRWSALQGSLLRGLRLDDVRVSGSSANASSTSTLGTLEFAWEPWRLLDGTLVLARVRIDGLVYERRTTGAEDSAALTPAQVQELLSSLPLAVQLQDFSANDIELRLDDSVFTLDALSGTAVLDDAGVQVGNLVVVQSTSRLSGTLGLDELLALRGELAWQTRSADRDFAGTLVLGGTLRQVEVEHALDSPLQITSTGTLVPGIFAGDDISIDLQHELAAQTLAPLGLPELSLRQGALTTRGSPEALSISGTLSPVVAGLDELNLAFTLTVLAATLRIDSLALTSVQLDLAASGSLQFAPLVLEAAWQLERYDPGASLPQVRLSGVSGTGTVRSESIANALVTTLELGTLTGQLNEYPLALSGTLNLRDATITGLTLQAASGSNTLQVSGPAGAEPDLRWNLQAPALQQLWQGLSGELSGEGSITGTLDAPEVNGRLEGQALQLGIEDDTFTLAALTIDAQYSNAANTISLVLGELTHVNAATGQAGPRLLLRQGTVQLDGTPAEHTLRADLVSPQGSLGLELQGAVVADDWRGTLQTVTIDSVYGDWALENPVALAYESAAFALAESCWRLNATRVCLQAGKAQGQGLDADLAVTMLPLTWLNPLGQAAAVQDSSPKPQGFQDLQDAFALHLPENLRAEGTLDLQLALRNLQGDSWDSLDLTLQPHDAILQISRQGDSEVQTLAPLVQRYAFEQSSFELHSAEDGWQGSTTFQVWREEEPGSVLQGEFSGDLTMIGPGDELAGEFVLDFADLGWLETLVPELREPVGTMKGTVSVGGTRALPQLAAQLQLQNGSFDLPLYGLELREVALALVTEANDELVVTGSASSGAGAVQVRSRISKVLQDDRTITAEIGGDNFLAYDTFAASITVSPRLQLDYADTALTATGSVDVNTADIDLEAVFGAAGNDTVGLSRDVVMVSSATADADGGEDADMPVTARLTLVLGDAVRVHGYNLDARLSGELMLEQTPGRPALLYGELAIDEGSYEIYNQRLTARDGRLLFFGNPANPVVDVRAYRETPSAEVGVLLSGNLDDIQGQLYSTPALPDNEILAILVTGKSFNNVNEQDSDALLSAIASFGIEQQGFTSMVGGKLGLDSVTVGTGDTIRDSALGLGKYITPDILMSYKVGLFDRQSVLSIDYRLNEHFKLEVQTGISQSVDISYTIEKD